jgi:hypothetical protein
MAQSSCSTPRGPLPEGALLSSSAGTFTPGITLGNLPQHNEALASSRQYGLIDALEKHGQWAMGLSWADNIHQSMRAKVTNGRTGNRVRPCQCCSRNGTGTTAANL